MICWNQPWKCISIIVWWRCTQLVGCPEKSRVCCERIFILHPMPLQHEDSFRCHLNMRIHGEHLISVTVEPPLGLNRPDQLHLQMHQTPPQPQKYWDKEKQINKQRKFLTHKENLKSKQTKTYNDENMEKENQTKKYRKLKIINCLD